MDRTDGTIDRRTFLRTAGTGAATAAVVAGRGGATDGATPPTDERTADDDRVEELTIAHGDNYYTLDPHRVRTIPDRDVVDAVYERPVARDHEGRIVGRLATDFEVDVESNELSFTIRDDAALHGGGRLSATDVGYSFRRLSSPDVGPDGSQSSAYSAVEDVATAGDVVTLSLGSFDGSLLAEITVSGYVVPEAWDRERTDRGRYARAKGTGPYAVTSFDRSSIRLERHADYWGQRPAAEAVHFTAVQDPGTRMSAAATGDLDVGAALDLETAADAPSEVVATGPAPRVVLPQIQNDVAPFDSREFRQALNYAVDVDGLVDRALYGFGEPIGQPAPSWFTGHSDAVEPYPYDPDRAESLVEASGYSGADIELHVPENIGTMGSLGRRISSMIDDLSNVSCEARPRRASELLVEVSREDRSASPAFYAFPWNFPQLDVGTLGDGALSSDSRYSQFHDRRTDDLLTDARNVTGQERTAILRELSEHLHEAAPFLFLFGQYQVHAVRPDLSSRLRPDGRLDVAAFGRAPAQFRIESVSVPDSVVAGESFDVAVTVTNVGTAAGETTLRLSVSTPDGGAGTGSELRLDAGESETEVLTVGSSSGDAGATLDLTVEVGDATVRESVAITEPETATTTPGATTGGRGGDGTTAPGATTTPGTTVPGDEPTDGGDGGTDDLADADSIPGFGPIATVAGLLGAAGLRRRRSDDED